ncbi:unnamed protein product [Thelazia callipaeda]|uniref:Protein kinase domain-containing protein n=1 Tax=Thelazia callipaeda TaxID=103827 RepID=A0A0N5D1E0_THECL|nr:unnamed protein product [Thelazia callipaeda]
MLDTVQLPLLLEQSSKARVSPAPPPPPPPPPPSLHSSSSKGLQQVTANNDSSSPGKKKWTLRVESRDTGRISSTNHRTEESIEIPKPQSVASLREQIASKLERKIASHIATFNGILPCKMQLINESPSSSLKESELTTESNVIEHANEEFNHQQHLVASTSMTHGRQAVFTSQMLLPEQQSVVHEPVQRHLSCITPLSFNRTTVLSSSTMHSPSMSNISTDGNDYQRTENIKNETRNRPIMQDRGQSLLPPSALSAPIGIIDFNANHSLDEHATMPSDSSHSGFFVNYQNKSRNERASSELEKIPVYSNHEHENQRNGTLPVANVGGEKSQFDAPSPSVTNARVLADAHKPLFSKPVELRTGIRSENGLLKTLQPETHAALHIPLKTISSHCSVPEQEMTVAAVASPQQDSHTENSSWYRTMFKKMHVVNLLGKYFY